MEYRALAHKLEPYDAELAKMIKSTRIRVARNLAGYPLGPGVKRDQRLQIERDVISACSQFKDDLAGTYYSLQTMSEADR